MRRAESVAATILTAVYNTPSRIQAVGYILLGPLLWRFRMKVRKLSEKSRSLASILLVVVFVFGPICLAQSNTATVFGSVTDASGSVVPAAAVKLQNVETNEVRSTTSALD